MLVALSSSGDAEPICYSRLLVPSPGADFERKMCVQELNWAIDAGKIIVPVVVAADKPKVKEYIDEGKTKGIDLSGCDFKHFDRSNKRMQDASLQTILDAMKTGSKAKKVAVPVAACGVTGLAKLLDSLGLGDKLAAADRWCVSIGADCVDDLAEEDYSERLAKELGLKEIKAKKLVKAIKGE